MSAVRTAAGADRAAALAALEREGCTAPRAWANGPGDVYGRHTHDRAKVLFCLRGSVVFHTDDGDVTLVGGDRLDLPARAAHAATVGPEGCQCVEAWGP